MYLFKAVVMCGQCGDVHNEKWLESKNRHASQTVLEMLCEPCAMNNLMAEDFDPWEEEYKRIADLDASVADDNNCGECGHTPGAHHSFCSSFDPMENAEHYYNGGK